MTGRHRNTASFLRILALFISMTMTAYAGHFAVMSELTSANSFADGAAFGHAVAISGDVAVVGAPFAGADGQQIGAVVVFARDADTGDWANAASLQGGGAAAGVRPLPCCR
ncbi:MAG TPA: FG-GAP repeat protein [Gammaproteobacteria bacterium]|nr:FG-GAP repeat protein [Gammaproteobacteria bacterium]